MVLFMVESLRIDGRGKTGSFRNSWKLGNGWSLRKGGHFR